MNSAVKVGIFMTVVLVLAAGLIIKIEDIPLGSGDDVIRVVAVFESVAGLDEKSAVRVAGIRVGKVESIELDGLQARAILLIDDPEVVLRQGAWARIANVGLLGDKYVELVPGAIDSPPLAPGSTIAGSMPTTIDNLADVVADVGADVKAVTSSLRKAMGGVEGEQRVFEIVENLRVTTEHLRAILAENRTGVGATVGNFEAFSADLRVEVPKISEQLQALIARLTDVVDENRGNVKDGIADIRQLASGLQVTVDNLNSITTKIDSGEGTIGKLVSSEEAHDQLTGALQSVKDGVASLTEVIGVMQRTRLDLGIEGAYYLEPEKSRTEFALRLQPKDSARFYRLGVASLPDGVRRDRREIIVTEHDDGSIDTVTVEHSKIEDRLALTVLLGLDRDDYSLTAGLIDGEGGVGIDYRLPRLPLSVSLEAYDFSREIDDDARIHLRLTGRYRLNQNLYVAAGWDDPLVEGERSLFFGGGLTWTDDYIKYLLGSVPIP